MNELRWCGDSHLPRVNDETQYFVGVIDHHFDELVPGYWVLAVRQIGFTQDDEDSFYTSGDFLQNSLFSEYFRVHVIVNKQAVWCVLWFPFPIEDTFVLLGHVRLGDLCFSPQTLVPMEFVQMLPVLRNE